MTDRPCDFCHCPLPPGRKHIHDECVFPEIEAILAGRLPFIRKVAPPRPADPERATWKRRRFAERAKAGRVKMALVDDDELRRRVAGGELYQAIARDLDVDPKSVRLRCRKLGIARPARAREREARKAA